MFSTIGYAICIPFAALLRLFYNLTGSYGVSLILFTLVIKLILLPFQMKSKKSMVRMSRMSGKMQEIQKKYANNQMKMQEEMQKFYQEEGFNPMSGCLWSFLPLPILMALYYIIRDPIVYFMNFGGKEAGLEVVEAARQLIEGAGIQIQASTGYEQIAIANIINSQFPDFIAENPGWISVDYHFLGIDLIQTPWSAIGGLSGGIKWGLIGLILIPIISGAFSFLLSKVSMSQSGQAANGSTKMMMWMMPLMSVYIAFIVPAALGVYWAAGGHSGPLLHEEAPGGGGCPPGGHPGGPPEAGGRGQGPAGETAPAGRAEEDPEGKAPGGPGGQGRKGQKGRLQHHGGRPRGGPPLRPRPLLQGGPLRRSVRSLLRYETVYRCNGQDRGRGHPERPAAAWPGSGRCVR